MHIDDEDKYAHVDIGSEFEVTETEVNIRERQFYPWEQCTRVGLGFTVINRTVPQMASAAGNCKMTQIKGWKFSCSKIEGGGVRVTRVK